MVGKKSLGFGDLRDVVTLSERVPCRKYISTLHWVEEWKTDEGEEGEDEGDTQESGCEGEQKNRAGTKTAYIVI